MNHGAIIDESVFIYNVAEISIGARAIISRNSTLCTANHNYNTNTFDLVSKPIVIKKTMLGYVWMFLSLLVLLFNLLSSPCKISNTKRYLQL